MTTAFPDYTGKRNYEESIEFVKARFKEQRKQVKYEIFINVVFILELVSTYQIIQPINI